MKKLILFMITAGVFNYMNAAKLIVPTNYLTIQLAINSSINGDTVVVLPGVYFENIHFKGKKIVLTSQFYQTKDTSFICSTIIDGSLPLYADTASCILLNSNEDSTTIIQGFTIRGGKGTKWLDIHGAGTYREGGGILTEFAAPIIQYNIICNNIVTNTVGVAGTGGGAIRSGDGNPTIRNNIICDNTASYGGGIVLNYCKGTIQNNIIKNNTGGQSYGGGGIWLTGSNTATRVDIINNCICNNHISGGGTYGGKGSALFVFSVKAVLSNNIIWGNTQSSGGVFTTFFGGIIQTNYNNVQSVVTGTGNISANPQFIDTTLFLLNNASPCIDAGDTAFIFIDNYTVSTADFPSKGSKRNDMGVYGGKYAFLLPGCNAFVTGINDPSDKKQFFVYPNPTNNFVLLNIPDKTKNYVIKLYDIDGRVLVDQEINSTSNKLDLKEISNGLFFIQLSGVDGDLIGASKLEILK